MEKILVSNEEVIIENNSFHGAEFIISIPIEDEE